MVDASGPPEFLDEGAVPGAGRNSSPARLRQLEMQGGARARKVVLLLGGGRGPFGAVRRLRSGVLCAQSFCSACEPRLRRVSRSFRPGVRGSAGVMRLRAHARHPGENRSSRGGGTAAASSCGICLGAGSLRSRRPGVLSAGAARALEAGLAGDLAGDIVDGQGDGRRAGNCRWRFVEGLLGIGRGAGLQGIGPVEGGGDRLGLRARVGSMGVSGSPSLSPVPAGGRWIEAQPEADPVFSAPSESQCGNRGKATLRGGGYGKGSAGIFRRLAPQFRSNESSRWRRDPGEKEDGCWACLGCEKVGPRRCGYDTGQQGPEQGVIRIDQGHTHGEADCTADYQTVEDPIQPSPRVACLILAIEIGVIQACRNRCRNHTEEIRTVACFEPPRPRIR